MLAQVAEILVTAPCTQQDTLHVLPGKRTREGADDCEAGAQGDILSHDAWASAFEALVEIGTKHPDPIIRVSATGKEGLLRIIAPSHSHPTEDQSWPGGYALPVYQASTLRWLVDIDEQVRTETMKGCEPSLACHPHVILVP